MLTWLKKFEETALGMLFTDQHLSPSEIVRIARAQRQAEASTQCNINQTGAKCDRVPHTPLIGWR